MDSCTLDNPCGKESCIVQRRRSGTVYEDKIFAEKNLPLRATCTTHPTPEQVQAMVEFFKQGAGPGSVRVSGKKSVAGAAPKTGNAAPETGDANP